jgi:GT2 family glycosyltransferase
LKILSWMVKQPGKNRCLNEAVRRASGNLIVFTDDDVIADRQWLRSLTQASTRWPEDDVFGGTIEPLFPRHLPSHVSALSRYYGELYSIYQPSPSEGYVKVPPFGPNLMMRKRIFEKFSYDETIGPSSTCYAMGSETELLLRLRKEGMKFVFVPDAMVRHSIREEQFGHSWLLERAFRSGRGMARLDRSNHLRIGQIPWHLPIKWQARILFSKANSLFGRRDAAFHALWKARRVEGAIHEYRKRQAALEKEGPFDNGSSKKLSSETKENTDKVQ